MRPSAHNCLRGNGNGCLPIVNGQVHCIVHDDSNNNLIDLIHAFSEIFMAMSNKILAMELLI